MSFRQSLTPIICENTTSRITLQLTDENDQNIDPGQLDAVVWTLYVSSKGSTFGDILNSRDHVDVLASVDAEGLISLEHTPEDNVLTLQRRGFETHVSLIEWTWAGGTRHGAAELSFTVANQSKMPAP